MSSVSSVQYSKYTVVVLFKNPCKTNLFLGYRPEARIGCSLGLAVLQLGITRMAMRYGALRALRSLHVLTILL